MNKTITTIYFIIIFSLMVGAYINSIAPTQVAYAKSPYGTHEQYERMFVVVKTWDDTAIKNLIHEKAVQYGVKESVMQNVIDCESHGSTTLQSYIVKNHIRENSWGIAQINLDYNPNITKEQALNPEFAVNFLAEEMANGNAKHWSCYKKIYMSK